MRSSQNVGRCSEENEFLAKKRLVPDLKSSIRRSHRICTETKITTFLQSTKHMRIGEGFAFNREKWRIWHVQPLANELDELETSESISVLLFELLSASLEASFLSSR